MVGIHQDQDAHGTSKRALRAVFAALLLAFFTLAFVAPNTAGALEVTSDTARPNGLAQAGIIGGKPTRVTWEADLGPDDTITAMTLVFPAGTTFKDESVESAVLTGTTKEVTKNKLTIETPEEGAQEAAVSMTLAFDEPIPADTHLRLVIEGVIFPSDGGTYSIVGSYEANGETQKITSAPEITVEKEGLAETIIAYLDQAEWVKKWDSVPLLNMFFKPQMIVAGIKTQFVGWVRALGLVAMGFPLAIPIGLMLAFIKISRLAPLKWLASLYINVIRGTPLFLQIYVAFFGLPLIGVQVNDYLLGGLVLAINSSAYLAEIFRAGIQSIHKGQFEAAASLGLSQPKAMIYVIIPQTVRRVLPTMTSEFILLYKDTSLLAAVGVMELMMFSKTLVSATGNVTPYVVAALYYMAVTLPLIKLVQMLEKKLASAEGSGDAAEKPKKKRFPWTPASTTKGELTASEHGSR